MLQIICLFALSITKHSTAASTFIAGDTAYSGGQVTGKNDSFFFVSFCTHWVIHFLLYMAFLILSWIKPYPLWYIYIYFKLDICGEFACKLVFISLFLIPFLILVAFTTYKFVLCVLKFNTNSSFSLHAYSVHASISLVMKLTRRKCSISQHSNTC